MYLLFTLLFIVSAIPLRQQRTDLNDGLLDLGFGNQGKVQIHIGPQDEGRAAAIQADGKIVIAGSGKKPGTDFGFLVLRFTADGNLDSSFQASDGYTLTTFPGTAAIANAIAIQPDGNLVVGGVAYNGFALVRYHPDGSLDNSFDFDGRVVTGFSAQAVATAVLIQPDGKIIATGYTDGDYAAVRYNPDGSLDTTFGNGGRAVVPFDFITTNSTAAALLPSGKILLVGTTYIDTKGYFAIARLKSSGSLDKSFGTEGKVLTQLVGKNDVAKSIVVQANGKFIVGGFAENPPNGLDFALVRYEADGDLDKSFGNGGKTLTNLNSSNDQISALALQVDGKIIAVGGADSMFTNRDFALVRYHTNGTIDETFGIHGQVITNMNNAVANYDTATAVVLQKDTKIVVAGLTLSFTDGIDLGLVRYESGIPLPQITNAFRSGKKLIVEGQNFDEGAVIYLNGDKQKTLQGKPPGSSLIAKQAGKKVLPGDKIQVRLPDGRISSEFTYSTPTAAH